MHKDNRFEWDPEENSFWEEDPEDSLWPSRRRSWPIRIGAAVLLVAFVAFAYAWLPRILPPHLDFLHQNQELSQDQMVIDSRPAVVGITVVKKDMVPSVSRSTSYGTGFNIDPQGVIITNRHVVEGAQSVQINFDDDKQIVSDSIELMDGADLAVIKLKETNLPYLPLGDQPAEPGETVTIIGNPRGVSRVAVRGTVKEYYSGSDSAPLVFSIEALIEPGSSGSPVLNEKAQVVGIVYALRTENSDSRESKLALAIPITYLP
ncbi:MAG: S1C family serine protease [Syntrophomonadaceae bacterium]